MSRRNIILHVLFIIISGIELVGRLIDNVAFEYPVKPFILVWIAVYFLLNSEKKSFRIAVLAAFFFSWVGDILLMFSGGYQSEMFFYAGVGGFFVAQVSYILIFLLNAENSIKGYLIRRPYWAVPMLAYLGGIFYVLYPKLEGIMVPVIGVYALSLIGMSLAALNRKDRVGFNSYRLVLFGSFFFVISDSMIAINKFHTPIPHAGFLIMATYILAQYLIMRGLILEKEK